MSAAHEIATPRQVKLVENRLIVLDGTYKCWSREECDRKKGEHFETYVRRHARQHGLGNFEQIEDAERNLFLNCLYFAAKYKLANEDMTPDPFWEHCTFLAEWQFHPDDLEQGHPRENRTWRLPDYGDMRTQRTEKRFKKIEKPRGSLKTSVGRAYVTWRLLRAYYIENNTQLRVLVISATSTLGRTQWFGPLKQLWSSNAELIRLFGMWEFTCDQCGVRQNVPRQLFAGVDHCPRCFANSHPFAACVGCNNKRWHRDKKDTRVHCSICYKSEAECARSSVLGDRVRSRQVGITTKGSYGANSIKMRWTVVVDASVRTITGRAVESFQFGGVGTELTGQRFDIVIADDLNTDKNVNTHELRSKVERTFGEVRRQLERGQFIMFCTRKHLDDLAGKIEDKTGKLFQQFHILSRRASWLNAAGETVYYWPVGAAGVRKLDEQFLREERDGTSEREFFSEYMNEPQDPTRSSFKSEWFTPAEDSQVPAPVLWGLGQDCTDEQLRRMREEEIRVDSFLYIDPAGHEEQKAKNDDTAMVGFRVYKGHAYVCLVRSFKGSDSYEKEQIFQAAVYLKPRRIRYERKNNDREGALVNGFANFCMLKTKELNEGGVAGTVHLPMDFKPASTIVSKRDKIEKTEPLWKAGRVTVLKSAGTPAEIEKFRDQFVNLGIASHDDYPDAASALQEDFGIPPSAAVAHAEKKAQDAIVNERGNVEISFGSAFAEMLKRRRGGSQNWGLGGGGNRGD